jgi:GH25 family lysozyme M1 (1,4-beta-N-acetylmuramidase)
MLLSLPLLSFSALNGIDISSWQSDLNVASVAVDFVIIKATEGVTYVNPNYTTHYQQAIKAGKKVGVYHFARPANTGATAEADHFIKNVKGYIKTAILVLDWEADPQTKQDPPTAAWAKTWLDRVLNQTGVHPLIYMNTDYVSKWNWQSVVSGNYGLWVAAWGSATEGAKQKQCPTISGVSAPAIKHWSFYAIWQWTDQGHYSGYSGDLDCDQFEGDAAAWDKYAKN